jgi:transposase
MAAHYGTGVVPTRSRRLRDKAKVEACVLIVKRLAHRSSARSPVLQGVDSLQTSGTQELPSEDLLEKTSTRNETSRKPKDVSGV